MKPRGLRQSDYSISLKYSINIGYTMKPRGLGIYVSDLYKRELYFAVIKVCLALSNQV